MTTPEIELPSVQFQPVFGPDGRVEKVEALSPPPRGASSDEIARHDDRVLQIGCKYVASWQDRCPGLGLSVNVLPERLLDPQFPAIVNAALRASRLSPPQLTLEFLEEPAILHDHPVVRSVQAQLLALGVNGALDDFGAPNSAVETPTQAQQAIEGNRRFAWRHLLSTIKLDGSLLAEGKWDRIAAFLRLAAQYGLLAIVEGVETAEHYRRLQQLGNASTLYQGWLFAKKVSPAEFETNWLPASAAPV